MRILVFAAALAAPVRAARFLHSLPDDAYAFPKYRVAFLNRLPLPSNTAQRWLADGLRGGELEFLDQPWTDRLDSLDPTPQVPPPTAPAIGKAGGHILTATTKKLDNSRKPQTLQWESFTLGKAPQPGADLTVAEQNAQTNLELAQSTGSRYLVQRWSDGTLCDKTHKPREVEVQFHCSMTMTDTILFVKEAKTCSYVLVVNTPRLCGEPGFKSHRDTSEEHQIRCREIVDPQEPSRATDAFDDVPDLLDYPVKVPRRKPVLPAAPAKETPKVAVDGVEVGDKVSSEVVRKALEALMGSKDGKVALQEIAADQNGVVFEIVEESDMSEDQIMAMEKLEETLRAAGHEIKTIRSVAQKGDKAAEKERGQAPTKKNKKPVKRWPWHEEL
ncbi:hypothetical protein C0989_011476 [Termitomyces sp. Mn162]|nr:hypothetical protein C0989_011476 [Termitomyces sp. Mn162]